MVVVAAPALDAAARQALYRAGVRLLLRPPPVPPPRANGGPARPADFELTPAKALKRLVVLWIRDASPRDARAALDAHDGRENVRVLLVTRAPDTLRAFAEIQAMALEADVRCVPVTRDIRSVAWALKSLERHGAGVRKTSSRFDLERTCTKVPRAGPRTFQEAIRPKAKTLKAVLQLSKTSDEAACKPFQEFFSQVL